MTRLFRSHCAVGLLGFILPAQLDAADSAVSRNGPSEVLNFALFDQRGQLHELRRMGGKAVVLFFTANGCPVARQNVTKLNSLRDRYHARGVDVFLVNASSGDDWPAIEKEMRQLRARHLPLLKDDTQGVARHLSARRTAEAVAISTQDWTIFYRGAIDDQLVEGASHGQTSRGQRHRNARNDSPGITGAQHARSRASHNRFPQDVSRNTVF